MSEKPKKKRIAGRILLILLVLLFVTVAVPVVVLYAQYRAISYTPFVPVERDDEYILPAYPEVIFGSEGITDIPDDLPSPDAPIEETSADTGTRELPEETTVPSVPETLPFVTYDPPQSEEQTSAAPTQSYTPPTANPDNSFANSSKTISVYGKTPIYKVEQRDEDVVNILVLGTDSKDVVWDRGRSDSMIVVSYHKKTGAIKMVSLLRDMLVPIEGYDWNRLNTAYFFDGVGLAINTVNQLFDLDIQHFIVIDFNGAKDFIDYVGGIELSLSESEAKHAGVPYAAEPIQLDGAAALRHMRNRSSDNDFGRTERQREVIVAVFQKILSEKSLTEILDVTQYGMGMVKTNIPATTLTALAASVVSHAGDISIQAQSVPYEDACQFAWYKKMAVLTFDIKTTAERLHAFLYE